MTLLAFDELLSHAEKDFREKLSRGHQAEKIAEAHFQELGWWILPSYDYSGRDPRAQHAPHAYGPGGELVILPDMFLFQPGCSALWCEIKWKAIAGSLYRKTGTYDHGIGKRLMANYRQIQQISGIPVQIWIFENETKLFKYQFLDFLLSNAREYSDNKMDKGGMLFWDREKLFTDEINPDFVRRFCVEEGTWQMAEC